MRAADTLLAHASDMMTIGTGLLMVIAASLYVGLMIRGIAGVNSGD